SLVWLSGTSSGGTGVGGSVNRIHYINNTTAEILSGAAVNTGSLLTMARTDERNISITIQGGKADSFAFNGASGWLEVDNQTTATISDGAAITVGSGQVSVPRDFDTFDGTLGESMFTNSPKFAPTEIYEVDSGGTALLRVDEGANTIRMPYEHGFVTDDTVWYDNGGGVSVGGLTTGTAYHVIRIDDHTLQLALTTTPGTAIDISLLDGGTPTEGAFHSLWQAFENYGAVTLASPGDTFYPVNVVTFDPALQVSSDVVGNVDHAFKVGDKVTYDNGGGDDIGGLADGTVYVIEDVSGGYFTLAQLATPTTRISLDPSTANGTNHTFTATAYNVIDLGYTNKLKTGDKVIYQPAGATAMTSLVAGTEYEVVAVDGSSKIALRHSGGGLVDSLSLTGVANQMHLLIPLDGSVVTVDNPLASLDSTSDGKVDTSDDHIVGTSGNFYYTDLSLLVLADDNAGLYSGTGGFTNGREVGVGVAVAMDDIARETRAMIGSISADLARFDMGVDSEGLVHLGYDHGLADGDRVGYTSGGDMVIEGLLDGESYIIEVVGTNARSPIRLARTALEASEDSSTNFGTTDVASALGADEIDLGYAHGFQLGDVVLYVADTSGVDIGGLVDGQRYYVIPTGPNTLALAEYESEALDTYQTVFDPTLRVQGTEIVLGYEHGFDHDQAVVYRNGGGASLTGLTDGDVYYINRIDEWAFELHYAPDAPGVVQVPAQLAVPDGAGRSHAFQPAIAPSTTTVSSSQRLIDLGYAHELATGDAVVYSSNGDTEIANLTSGNVYYAIVDGETTLALASTAADAEKGVWRAFDTSEDVVDSTLWLNTLHQYQLNDELTYSTTAYYDPNSVIPATALRYFDTGSNGWVPLTEGQTLYAIPQDDGDFVKDALNPDDAATAGSLSIKVSLTVDGPALQLSTVGALGVHSLRAVASRIAVSSAGATGVAHTVQAYNRVDLDTTTGSGTGHRLRLSLNPTTAVRTSHALGKVMTPSATNIVDDVINAGFDHGFSTGDAIVYSNGGGVSVGGINHGTKYYVIRTGAQTFKLAETLAKAIRSTPDALELDTTDATGSRHAFGRVISAQVGLDSHLDTIDFGRLHPFRSGDSVVYSANGGTAIGGLVDGTTYIVEVVNNTTIQLKLTPAGNVIDLDGSATTTTSHTLTKGTSSGGFVTTTGDGLLVANNGGEIISVSLAASKVSDSKDGGKSAGSVEGNESDDTGQPTRFGLAVAGDVAFHKIDDTTQAMIVDADVTMGGLILRARNDTSIATGSGAVAISSGSDNSTGIAGSVSINIFDCDTDAIIDNSIIVINGGDLTLDAENVAEITAVAAGGAFVQGGIAALAGSVVFNQINSDATAQIRNQSDVTVTASTSTDGNVTLSAHDDNTIIAVAGSIAVATGSTGKASVGLGAALAVNVINSDDGTAAVIEDSDVDAAGLITLDAQMDNDIKSFAAAVAYVSGLRNAMAIAVSIGVNYVSGNTHARIRRKKTAGTGVSGDKGVYLYADDHSIILVVGGTAAISNAESGAAAGAAITVNVFDSKTTANIRNTTVISTAGDVQVLANSAQTLDSYAVGAAVSGSEAFQGSFSINVLDNETHASIDGTAVVFADGNVVVSAQDSLDMVTLGGSVAIAGLQSDKATSIGVANSTVITDNEVQAWIGDGTTIQANGDQLGYAAHTGHVGADGTKKTQTDKGLIVTAVSHDDITTIAAGGSVSTNSAAIAGSATVTIMDEKTSAWIGAGALVNQATVDESIAQDVIVRAGERTDLTGIAGALSASFKSGGYGAGVDLAVITKNTDAWIGVGAVVDAEGDVIVEAVSEEKIISVSASIAAGKSTGIAGGVGISVYDINTHAYIDGENTTAGMDGAVVTADGSVVVSAQEQLELDMGSGSGAFGKDAGIAASVDVPIITKDTQAWIGQEAIVNAYANRTGLTVLTGDFDTDFNAGTTDEGEIQPVDLDNDDLVDLDDKSYFQDRNASPATRTGFTGVAVTAVSYDAIEIYTVGASGSFNAAIQLSLGFSDIEETTEAFIASDAEVNQTTSGAGVDQSVLVTAGNDFFLRSVAGGLAISKDVAVTPGVDISLLSMVTRSFIGSGAKVDAVKDVEVTAYAEEDVLVVAVAVAGSYSAGSVAGSVALLDIDNTTHAFIGSLAEVDARGNVRVYAEDRTDSDVIGGGGSVSISGGGFGVSLAISQLTKDTQAFIDNYAVVDGKGLATGTMTVFDGGENSSGEATTDDVKGVSVSAFSYEDMFALSVSGGAGSVVGVAGALNWHHIDSDTHARIADGAMINTAADNGTAISTQDVYVTAVNKLDVTGLAGALSGSLGGTLGAGVDIGVVGNETRAILGGEVHARDDVFVAATADWDIWSLGIAASVAPGALTGGITNWSLGADVSGDYSADGSTFDSLTSNNGGSASQTESVLDDSSNKDMSYDSGASGTTDSSAQVSAYANRALDDLDKFGPLQTSLFSETQAIISDNADVTAGDDVTVRARQDIEATITSGGFSLTGVGVGAGVGIMRNGTATVASIGTTQANSSTGAKVHADGDMTVQATADEYVRMWSFAGTFGVFTGAAAYAQIDDDSVQSASIGEHAHITGVDDLAVLADHDLNLKVTSGGGSVGIAAVGVAAGHVDVSGEVVAFIGSSAVLGDTDVDGITDRIGSVTVQATSNISQARAYGVAVAGGIYSGAGVDMTTSVDPLIQAFVGSDAEIYSDGSVVVVGNTDVETDAEGRGYAGATSLTVGISFATAVLSPDVQVGVGADAVIYAPDITIKALHNVSTAGNNLSNKADAMAAASAGALLGAGTGAHGEAEAKGTAQITINDRVELTATEADVIIESRSFNHADAEGDGQSYGFVGVGVDKSQATLDSDTTVDILTDVVIISQAGDVAILAKSKEEGDSNSKSGQAGVLTWSEATADIDFTGSNTSIDVGDRTRIEAGEDLTIRSTAAFDADAHAETDNPAVSVATHARAHSDVTLGATQTTDIGDAMLIGETVHVLADVSSVDAEAEADAVAGWNVNAGATAGADVTAELTPAITVSGGATITGRDSVEIIAEQKSVTTKADAKTQKVSLSGYTTSNATNTQLLNATVTTDTDSQIRTQVLTVEANVPSSPGITTKAPEKSEGFNGDGSTSETQTFTRVIDFNSTVVIIAPSPFLNIDSDGVVTGQYGVTWSDTGSNSAIVDGTLTIGDIINTGALEGLATFSITHVPNDSDSDDTSQLKGTAKITFQTTYSAVTITNDSPYHMILSEMDLLNESAVTSARITKSVGDDSLFTMPETTDPGTPDVLVRNALGIQLAEPIVNTWGSTELISVGGNLTVSSTGKLESHEMILTADAGVIGSSTNRFLTTGSSANMSGRLAGSASGDIYIQHSVTDLKVAGLASTAGRVDLLVDQSLLDGSRELASSISTGSNTATTLEDTQQLWRGDEWAGLTVRITGGLGIGQERTISSNTGIALTVSSAWTTTPDNTSRFAILDASSDQTADVTAGKIKLRSLYGTIGSSIDAVEVDASTVADGLNAQAAGDLYVIDVADSVTVGAILSDAGNVGFTVADGDNAGEDFTLSTTQSITATLGSVAVTVGDNFTLASGGAIAAAGAVTIAVDQEGLDYLTGSTVDLLGTLTVGTTLTLTGGPDDDTINLPKPTSATLTVINAGSGVDIINIGNAPLDGVTAVRVDGGTGADVLILDDSGDTDGNAAGGLFPSSVTGFDGMVTGFDLDSAIHYKGLAELTLNLGIYDDTITVTSTATDTLTTINTGDGANAVVVGHNADGVNRILGTLDLNAGSGVDSLTVNDSADGSSETGLLTPSTLTGLGMGDSDEGIVYGGFEQLDLSLSNGGNILTIAGVSVPTEVVSGSGNDEIIISEADLSGITQALTLTGQDADTDKLSVTLSRGVSMDIGAGVISGAAMTGSIQYSGMGRLTLNLGNATDIISINDNGVPVEIFANGGSDSIIVDHLANEGIFHLGADSLEDQVFVNSSDAPLTVYGGDLLDDLIIDLSETTGGVDASLVDHAVDDNTGVLTGVLGGLLTFTDL
ncbi:MAG: hypothetical protein GY708_03325, partial [Actinomycetia bacterium]|nr:hypothetical protein [Actinomycetes bacterium]